MVDNTEKEDLIQKLLTQKAESDNTIDLNAYALGLDAMYDEIYGDFYGTQKQFCGRNVTTCIYFVEGTCKNAPSECRDQVTKLNKK